MSDTVSESKITSAEEEAFFLLCLAQIGPIPKWKVEQNPARAEPVMQFLELMTEFYPEQVPDWFVFLHKYELWCRAES